MGKVLFIACTPVGRAMIEEIKNNDDLCDVEVVGIVNINSTVAINKANYDSYVDLTQKYDIPIYYCENINEKDAVSFIKSKSPDIIIQSGWSQYFKSVVLNLAKYACIGEHPAPLPRGRGAACVNWAIITGEKDWGDTFFKMEKEYDSGEVYAQEFFKIESYDNVKTVYDKVAQASAKIVRKNMANWTNGILNGQKQGEASTPNDKRRRPEDGLFSFNDSAESIYNNIRGQTKPYPGAFFRARVNGKNTSIYVWDAKLSNNKIVSEIKKINLKKESGCAEILCGDNSLLTMVRVQEKNGVEMWAYDFFLQNHVEII